MQVFVLLQINGFNRRVRVVSESPFRCSEVQIFHGAIMVVFHNDANEVLLKIIDVELLNRILPKWPLAFSIVFFVEFNKACKNRQSFLSSHLFFCGGEKLQITMKDQVLYRTG